MRYDRILIRYGEMSTKGKNRNRFVVRLKRNIQKKLTAFPNIKIEYMRDRMYILLNGEPHEEIMEQLKTVFGIQSFSLAMKCENDIEQIKTTALAAVQQVEGKTFKVSAKRIDKQFPIGSNELNYTLGSHILRNTNHLTVNVHEPDIDVRVEVRKDGTYVTCHDIPGAGGLPVGTSGKAMLMLSGGIDSPVAGYLAMKRGLEIEAVHFFSPPFTSERAKQKVVDLVKKLTRFGGKIRLHIVPFTDIQQTIHQQVPNGYSLISSRRMMLKITDMLRKKYNGLAIVTGESLGQVASQTLESMFVINDVTTTPVLRPLVSMDKTEIIAIAKKIDTLDISVLPYEDCCTIFTPSAPKTRPKREKVVYYESFIDLEPLLQAAVANTETIIIDEEFTAEKEFEQLF
ncbi:thiamine biosynthesis protein ThiI [Anoxybacillus voinovskiensis]|uniref:Probable tRNA sulfurtransferase n=1 Tax=Anoxybacteroides voinovskiense TaxID=230470 RepID=A0A840DQR0_9BACL|nr:tRNA uracil 4-sulfurtransferase ThiI [Anoxybacillus voinovskiensis]MBB4073983.1 thiamine biosynthesis protein ThiI [Anoxybacillus voinovskiensis]GGJ67791.1 putative tRNA sulfurtransferase [Anoxybacillus voinovskiensis]